MSTVLQNQVTANGRNRSQKIILLTLALIVMIATAILVLALPALRASGAVQGGDLTLQAQWESQGIESYAYDLQVSCFCIIDLVRPVHIVVENGEVSSITYLDDGTPADAALFNGFATIDQLYENLAANEALDPVKFDVTYDETLGVPLSVDVDVSEMMADEELRFTVTNFEKRP
jgi:hypothetical protein